MIALVFYIKWHLDVIIHKWSSVRRTPVDPPLSRRVCFQSSQPPGHSRVAPFTCISDLSTSFLSLRSSITRSYLRRPVFDTMHYIVYPQVIAQYNTEL